MRSRTDRSPAGVGIRGFLVKQVHVALEEYTGERVEVLDKLSEEFRAATKLHQRVHGEARNELGIDGHRPLAKLRFGA